MIGVVLGVAAAGGGVLLVRHEMKKSEAHKSGLASASAATKPGRTTPIALDPGMDSLVATAATVTWKRGTDADKAHLAELLKAAGYTNTAAALSPANK